MPSMKTGVLDRKSAQQLMAVLEEMSEYVDGEDLASIGAQKPIYEGMEEGAGGGGGMLEPMEDLPEGEAAEMGVDSVQVPPEGMEEEWKPPTFDPRGRRR